MNVIGSAYCLTMLSPLLPGRDASGAPHDTAVRSLLAAMPADDASPLAQLDFVHLARWVVIEDAFYEGYPESVDHYASRYLLFTACFDGTFEHFIEAVRTTIPDAAAAIWSHCVGFPGVENAGLFERFMKRCQVETTFPFAAYPTSTLPRVLRALDAQRRFLGFLAAHQADGDDDLQRAFRVFMRDLERAATPAPASI